MTLWKAGVALLAAAPLAGQDLPSTREIAAAARPAVVSVRGLDGGQVLTSGTGFVVREDGVIVSNLHVVRGAGALEVEMSSGEVYHQVYVLDYDERRDLILLQIPAVGLETIAIGDDRALEVGDPIYVMGNPLGLNWTFSDGLLSAKRTEEGVTYLQISAPISAGSSGGPVLDRRGEAVGVATLTFEEGQNLNLAIPARHAAGMLALGPEPRPFGEAARELEPVASGADDPVLTGAYAEIADELELTEDQRRTLAELEDWERSVAVQLLRAMALYAREGWTALDDRSLGYLEVDEVDGMRATLRPGSYMALAVCDDDCSDIDLAVFDGSEKALDRDVLEDAFPVVDFSVPRKGDYSFVASMVECSYEPCYYAIQLFRRK